MPADLTIKVRLTFVRLRLNQIKHLMSVFISAESRPIEQLRLMLKKQDCAGLASGRALADGFKTGKKEYFCTFSLFYHSKI